MAFADYDNKSVDASIDRADSFFSEWERQRSGTLQTLTEDRRLAEEDLEKVEAAQSRLNALPAFAQELTETDLESVQQEIAQARDVIKMFLEESAEAIQQIEGA